MKASKIKDFCRLCPSTKNRKPYLQNKTFREEVFRYLAGTIEGLGAKSLIVGGYVDHVHLLVRLPAKECVSKIVGQTKSSTSLHINANSNQIHKFGWQDGFGVFTLSSSDKDRVYHYIATQEEHHSGRSFLVWSRRVPSKRIRPTHADVPTRQTRAKRP